MENIEFSFYNVGLVVGSPIQIIEEILYIRKTDMYDKLWVEIVFLGELHSLFRWDPVHFNTVFYF